MAGKQRVSVGRVRQKVREVLGMQEGEPLAEKPLLEAVNELVGGGVDLTQLRDACDWNHGESFIRREYVEELDLDGWVITKLGINHERIK
jgi:hypothetical protein